MNNENSVKLSDIASGDNFVAAGKKWIKFFEIDGQAVVLMQESWERAIFDCNTNNYAKSELREKLEETLLPELERAIGSDNMYSFPIDLMAEDGTMRDNRIVSKISLPTLDFYRNHRPTFTRYDLTSELWLATANKEDDKYLLTPSAGLGIGLTSHGNSSDVHPLCIFNSNIFVSKEQTNESTLED